MVFGYLNRNYEEELDIPLVGPEATVLREAPAHPPIAGSPRTSTPDASASCFA